MENLNIEEVMQKGEHVKVQFLDEAAFSEKSYIKKSDALILGALKELGDRLKAAKMDEHKDIYENIDVLNANYMNNFTSSVKDNNSIKYTFGSKEELDYSDKTIKTIKKSAKRAQDIGLAEIKDLEEYNFRDKAKQFFRGIFKKPTLALKAGIEKAKSVPEKLKGATEFVENKVEGLKSKQPKNPRESLGLNHIEINHGKALERVKGEIVSKEEMEAKRAAKNQKEKIID